MKKNRLVLVALFVLNVGLSNAQITWEPINGLPEGKIGVIAISPDNQIFVNYHEGGFFTINDNLYRSIDNGDTWEQIAFFDSCSIHDICFATQNDIYVGVGIWAMGGDEGKRGIMYSGDNGEDWSYRYEGEPGCGHIYKVCMNNTGDLIAITDLGDVFQLSKNGEDWANIFNCETFEGGCQAPFEGWDNTLSARDILITNNNQYYLSTSRGLAISDNKGANWSMFELSASVNCISVYDNNDIVVGTDEDGLYYFDTANKIWTHIGLSGHNIKTIISQNNKTLYVATQDSGFYFTNNNGDSWLRLNEGLDTLGLLSMAIDYEWYLYLGTSGKGLYKSVNTTVNIANYSSTALCTLDQNYPNPFKNHTTFRFTLRQPTHVKLSIYNVLGELKEIVLDEYMTNGNHSVNWDANNISSGLYFYRIESVDFSLTKTFLVQ
jgi:photosystem II stability/assembly factor-like uncharacterized protein